MNMIYKMLFALLIISLMIIPALAGVTIPENSTDRKYGGINQGFNNPPEGTTINENLSTYYGCPVATGNNTYFYYGYFWFTSEEVKKLPEKTLRYGENPYTTESKNSNDIKMPINNIALMFVCLSVFVMYKKSN